jgi:hypothetical protein
MERKVLLTAALIASILGGPAWGEEMDVPLDVQLPLLLKVMTYDQTGARRGGGAGFYIAIAYSSSNPISAKVKEMVLPTVSKLRLATIDNKSVNWTFVDLAKGGELDKILKAEPVTALYVTPGLKGQIPELVRTCQEAQVSTVTGVSAYVAEGISVGIGQEEGKPKIVVNLPSSKAEGSSFSSSLLGLARVIR